MRPTLKMTGMAVGWGLLLLPPATSAQPAPGPGAARDYGSSPLVTRMLGFDKNSDGKLTREEITDPGSRDVFDEADADRDGVVSKEELMALAAKRDAAGGGGRGPGGAGGRDGRGGPNGGGFGRLPILKALDTDGDGELSAKEIDAAAESLRPLDTNKDGKLTRDELLGNVGEGRGEARGGGRGEGGRGGSGGAELVTQLMAFDKNGDGKLTADELPERMRNLVERADANKDGAIDKDELARYAEQQSQPQQQSRGGRGEGRGGPGANGPGRSGFAMLPVLKALDTDANGELSAGEIASAPAALRSIDRNKDGKLTRDELFGDMGGDRRGGRGRGGSGQGAGGAGPRGE